MNKESLKTTCFNFYPNDCKKCPFNEFEHLCVMASIYQSSDLEILIDDLEDEISEIKELIQKGVSEDEKEIKEMFEKKVEVEDE